MPNRIEELFEELAENWNSEEGQNYLDYQKDLARKTAWTALGLLPLPGARALLGTKLASKVPGAEKLYGQVGQDFTKFIEPLKSKLSGVFGRSGSGVGADVAGRYALPKAKPSVVTKRGPRGPINIGQPPAGPPRPAPSRTTRLSETDREMIKRLLIPPLTQTGQRATQVSAKETARKARVEIKKLNRWKKGHQAKVRRGDDQYQEGMRSGYEPDIKGGEKMMRESRKRIQEIQAKLDELYKKL